ncbi:MAG: hypothetical protein ACO4CS_14650 [bacterium]
MSQIGYIQIIEHITEECMDYADTQDELEARVSIYVESVAAAVQQCTQELIKNENE